MWTLKPEERLREWKSFRNQIGAMSIEDACKQTTHLWSYAPYLAHYLDPDRSHSMIAWPDPWLLLHENHYCDLAKSLGMLYTLYLSEHKPTDLTLSIYRNAQIRETHNLVELGQGKYILNFEFDTVVNITQLPKCLDLKYRYTTQELGLDLY